MVFLKKCILTKPFFQNVFAIDVFPKLKDSFFSKTTNNENELMLYDTLLHIKTRVLALFMSFIVVQQQTR
jgi:hypothetical protein